jgi:chorismate mutase
MTKSWAKTLIVLAISFPLSAQTSSAENPSERLQPLVKASAERIDLAREVALAKWDSGAAVEDLVREQQVIQAVVKAAPQRGLDESFVTNFFRGQIEANKTVQYVLLADWHRVGRAPVHSPINLGATVRPQLDALETEILDNLKNVSDIRESPNCQAALATAMGVYLKRQKDRTDNLDAIALDRSMASFCARQQR